MDQLIIRCINCGKNYPEDGLPYNCPSCGGVFDFHTLWKFDPALIDRTQPGIWCYRHAFGIPAIQEAISLGEGNTPLLWVDVFGRKIGFKCEIFNPTGSFKDRGSTVLAGWLKNRGITEIVEDSSGNAGASLAAYSVLAAVKANIFLPAYASGPKRRQIEALGANIISIQGSRSDTTQAVSQAAEKMVYASHAYLPFNILGYATISYELFSQLNGHMPGAVIVPVGQGGLLLGISRGFRAIREAFFVREDNHGENKLNLNPPRLIGVQASACAPLWAISTYGVDGIHYIEENPTLAEGVKVKKPVRWEAVIRETVQNYTYQSKKIQPFFVVDEDVILEGREALARLGFFVEPTSAIVWGCLRQIIHELPDPVVVILTGSGYKYNHRQNYQKMLLEKR